MTESELYLRGKSLREIADLLDIHYNTVLQRLKKQGTSLRRRGRYRNPPGYNKRVRRFRKYGITEGRYNIMLEACGNRCEVCRALFTLEKRNVSHIDHCHSTGLVRGLLCMCCNSALGMLREDPDLMRALIKYVEKHK